MVCKTAPIGSPTHRVNEQDGRTQEVADYETALDSAGYGRFSRAALGACSCAFFTTGVQNCVMSYVLPAAKCELQLTTYQAGLVNMAFMCGGVASAFFWGIVGDVFGRRNTLTMTLLLDGVLTLAQSTVADYRWLLVARSINGFLIGGPSTLTFTYMSDLVGERRRQFYLTIVGMSFVGAWLILPDSTDALSILQFSWHLALGLFLWSIIEYSLHRWVFHLDPGKNLTMIKIHFLIHGLHHKMPFDGLRQVFPPVPALMLACLIYQPVSWFLSYPLIKLTGGLIGYLTYDMIHYYVHHGSPADGTYLYAMKRYHSNHHFVNHDKAFGISSEIWDHVFKTFVKLRTLGFSLRWD